jgi:hypothetical protein
VESNRKAEPGKPITRRQFLGRLGAGAAGVAALGAAGAIGIDLAAPRSAVAETAPQVFGRIFPSLPPFARPSTPLTTALLDIGRQGGPLDANDDLAAGPVALITDPNLSLNNPDNPTHTAGTTFMGQFMDHDMTFDTSSRLGIPTDPGSSPNARTPTFDLDTVYAAGPDGSPQLYDQADTVKLRVESTQWPDGGFEDLPRMADATAIIGDARNDENMVIAGLHAACLLFHNNAVDWVRDHGIIDPPEVFAQARRLVTWHYHWVIVHEFLPLFVGQDMVDAVQRQGRRYYLPPAGGGFMPVEFQGACYRFGHSMVRPSYRANFTGEGGGPFFGFIFDPDAEAHDPEDPEDLSGGARAARRFIGWQTFFDFGDGRVKRNKRIDRHISTPLFTLPLKAIPSHAEPTALAQRNLLRQVTWSMPSGQSIAKLMDVDRVTPSDLKELGGYGLGLDKSTPLWYYALAEASVVADGLHLGPVGGRIVAEVILGLLQTDPGSYLYRDPSWTPTLPSPYSGPGEFRMIDFLAFAGVDGLR